MCDGSGDGGCSGVVCGFGVVWCGDGDCSGVM